ncbi:transforming growth factor-beta-induced protein ig-h3-like [Daphnia pulex]|uniref:transforming growth factor-beta-induced protein ig-h3-like n=1 Tax=Daphnia pulex TaxID=6669 RepID=UPI001EDE7D5C|nr:transforming growth factor-beta-induced protein ig-h3-like [Daphnia pulex]
MKPYWVIATLLVASSAIDASPVSPNSVKVMLISANFTALVDSLVANRLDDVLNATGPITIFCPTNEAFKAMMDNKPEMVKGFNGNTTHFKRFLHYHVVPRKIMPADIHNDMTVTPFLKDKQLRFNVYGTDKKIMTVNGVMFGVPTVVTPTVVMYKLNNFLLCAIGGGIFDLLKIHKQENKQQHFTILVEAIQLVNLTHTLEKEGPFTLFAPNDDAFRRLPDGVLNKLMASPAELKTILLGHIVSGTYFLSGLTNESDLPTLDGRSNRIAVGNTLTVDGAKINVEADMLAANGVVHVIDRVLMS